MTITQDFIGAGYAVMLAIGVTFTSYVLAWKACGTGDRLTRFVAVVGVAACLLTALFHGLTTLRVFSREYAAVATALLAVISWRFGGGRLRLMAWLQRDLVFIRRVAARFRASRHRAIVVAFVISVAPALLRTLVVPPLGWDALTYHALKPALWVQHGAIAGMDGPGPWTYYKHMLAGGEVFVAWAMLATWSDVFVPLVDVAEWVALGLALVVLARSTRVREPYASTAAAFVLALPTVRLMLASAYVELCLLATLVIGLALGLSADGRRPWLLVIAGGALGVSAATKTPMIPVTGIILGVLIVRALGRRGAVQRLCVLCAIVAYAIALAPWLIAATMETGAPLSPHPVAFGRWVVGKAGPELLWFLQRSTTAGIQAATEFDVLKVIFAGPPGTNEALGAFALFPLAITPIAYVALVRRSPFGALVLLLAMVGSIATFYSPQLWVMRHFWVVSSGRFLLPAVTVATVASVAWCENRSPVALFYRAALMTAVLWNLLQYATYGFSQTSMEACFLVLLALVVMATAVRAAMFLSYGARAIAVLAIVLAGIVSIERVRADYRSEVFGRDWALHPFVDDRYWATTLPVADDPGVHRRIAITSGPHQNLDNWFAYPLLGRNLQNEVIYVPPTSDGRIPRFGADDIARIAHFSMWSARLRERGVTNVMSFRPASIELHWMEEHREQFERMFGVAGQWGFFRVLDAPVRP